MPHVLQIILNKYFRCIKDFAQVACSGRTNNYFWLPKCQEDHITQIGLFHSDDCFIRDSGLSERDLIAFHTG